MRRRRSWVPALVVLLVLSGCRGPGRPADASLPSTAAPASSLPAVHARGYTAARALPDVAPPDRLLIPSLGVDSALDRLHRLPDGTLEVPQRWGVAGWFEEGPRPGEPGPAAILGHVDSTTGAAVFARLHELRAGDEVDVVAGTRRRVFRVTGTEEVAKTRFPSQQVYLPTLEPVLRLITCGGAFDATSGHYTDNVIVSARLSDGN